MNLLPFVSVLLVVISLSMASFFQDYTSLLQMKNHFMGNISAQRLARNKLAVATFNLHKPADAEKKESSPKEKKQKPYQSFRLKSLTENSMLNIAPLLEKNASHPFLEKTLTNLLDELYGNAPFYKDKLRRDSSFTKHFVQELLDSLRTNPHLYEVRFKTPTYEEIWYKMLKGSKEYSLEKKEGMIPLSSLLIIHPDKKRGAICFQKAPPCLLRAAFGEEVTKAILEKEKEKHEEKKKNQRSCLDDSELSQILSQKGFLSEKKYLQMKPHRTIETLYSAKDKQTGIEAHIRTKTKKTAKKSEKSSETSFPDGDENQQKSPLDASP